MLNSLCVQDFFGKKENKIQGTCCDDVMEEKWQQKDRSTLPIAEILSGKNARAWVSMVWYLKR